MHRFIKPNFIFLAVALLIAPLALNAQETSHDKWNGVYVGVIGGTAAGNYNFKTNDDPTSVNLNSALEGGRVGVQGGIDFHVKGLVVGAAADWSWTDARFTVNGSILGINADLHSGVKQMTTFRGRVGKRYGHVLPYVHGGLLLADSEFKVSGDGDSYVIENGVHPGFVVGAGFDYALARHYFLSTEYGFNHINGIDVSAAFLGGPDTPIATEHLHYNTLTVGFNYRF